MESWGIKPIVGLIGARLLQDVAGCKMKQDEAEKW
jgi:hypothetical protein